MRYAVLACALFASLLMEAAAQATADRKVQQGIDFEQRVGAKIPENLTFTDSHGARVALDDLVGDKPVILQFAWYNCRNLCGISLRGLAQTLPELPYGLGEDYRVVTVSIDAEETEKDARTMRRTVLRAGGMQESRGWHFLVGDRAQIDALADAVGFQYVYDPETEQYAHPAGFVLLTPDRQVSQYLFSMQVPVRDLRLALVEAGQGEVGSTIDQIALRCHRFDPETGEYTLAVMQLLRIAGGGTALLVFGGVGWWWWRENRARGQTERNGHGE